MVIASSIKLHVSYEGIGVDREAVGDYLSSGGYSKTGLCLVVFPKKGEGNPWRMMKNQSTQEGCSGLRMTCVFPQMIVCMRYSTLTLRTTQSRVTDARILVVSKVEKGAAVISVQIDALVDHSFNNICSKEIDCIISLKSCKR